MSRRFMTIWHHPKFAPRPTGVFIPTRAETLTCAGGEMRFARFHRLFLVVTFIVLAISWILWHRSRTHARDQVLDFHGFDNVSGADSFLVPNVIHYVRFQSRWNFVEAVCVLSAWRNHRPEKMVFHADPDSIRYFTGPYWQRIEREIDPKSLQIVQRPVPTHVFGVRLSSIYHASDVARIQILMERGGIFLDNDVFVIRSLDRFRRFEMAIGWPRGQPIGTQVLVAHRDARFLRLWLDGYRHYQPTSWYYNAGHLPTRFLERQPQLVHRVLESFGVHDLTSLLYGSESSTEWMKFHTVHLLIRHRYKLTPDDIRRSNITHFDEHNIQIYRPAFGHMARMMWNNVANPSL